MNTETQQYWFSAGTEVLGPLTLKEFNGLASEQGIDLTSYQAVPVGETEWRDIKEYFGNRREQSSLPSFKNEAPPPLPAPAVVFADESKRHLLLIDGKTVGPFDGTELLHELELIPESTVMARLAGMVDWMPIDQYLQGLEKNVSVIRPPLSHRPDGSDPAKTQKPPSAPEPEIGWGNLKKKVSDLASNPYATRARGVAGDSVNLFSLFVSRIVRSDFTLVRATEEEKQKLESNGISSALAQDYAAWRRSALGLAALLLGSQFLFGLFDLASWWLQDDDAPILFKLWMTLFQGVQAVALAMLGIAFINWSKVDVSKSLSIVAWGIQFVGPMVLLLIPLTSLGLNQEGSTIVGATLVLQVMAKAFGLFPGLIRSALTLKTLLPQGRHTGWVAFAVAPFYAIFLMLLSLVNIQASQTSLALGLLSFSIAGITPLLGARKLGTPCDESLASELVRTIRRRQGSFLIAGSILIGYHIVNHLEISFGLVNAVSGFFGNVALVTLLMADLIVATAKKTLVLESESAGSEAAKELQQRLKAL